MIKITGKRIFNHVKKDEMTGLLMKTCKTCSVNLPSTEFNKASIGFQSNCKKCASIANKTKYKFISEVKHETIEFLINSCFTCNKKLQITELHEANNSFQYNCRKCTSISNKIKYESILPKTEYEIIEKDETKEILIKKCKTCNQNLQCTEFYKATNGFNLIVKNVWLFLTKQDVFLTKNNLKLNTMKQ